VCIRGRVHAPSSLGVGAESPPGEAAANTLKVRFGGAGVEPDHDSQLIFSVAGGASTRFGGTETPATGHPHCGQAVALSEISRPHSRHLMSIGTTVYAPRQLAVRLCSYGSVVGRVSPRQFGEGEPHPVPVHPVARLFPYVT